MGVNVEGNNGCKRKMQEAHKRKMQGAWNGSCECVTQDEGGQQQRPEHEAAACTIFSPMHFSELKLFPSVQPLFAESTFQPLTFAIGLSVPIWWVVGPKW